MKNLGNSCYINSVMQALFTVPSFIERYLYKADELFQCCFPSDAHQDFDVQMAKLATGLFSGRLAKRHFFYRLSIIGYQLLVINYWSSIICEPGHGPVFWQVSKERFFFSSFDIMLQLVHLKLQTCFVLPGIISEVLFESFRVQMAKLAAGLFSGKGVLKALFMWKHDQLCNIVQSFHFMPVESKQNKAFMFS